MKAGRELDALIAEKVFGRDISQFNELGIKYLDNAVLGDFSGIEFTEDGGTTTVSALLAIPHYSTQIYDAWLVVEKFADERTFMMGRYNLSGGRRWVVDIYCGDWAGPRRGIADTAPLAICLAALKTMEED